MCFPNVLCKDRAFFLTIRIKLNKRVKQQRRACRKPRCIVIPQYNISPKGEFVFQSKVGSEFAQVKYSLYSIV
jgi:hypothetical protein